MKTTIKINRILSNIISSRTSIELIKSEIEKKSDTEVVILDFNNVEVISRSFAHELVLFLNSNLSIEISNTNEPVTAIIEAVKKTRGLRKKTYDNIPIVHFNSNGELFDFLAKV